MYVRCKLLLQRSRKTYHQWVCMEKLYRSPYKFKETMLVSHVNIFTSKMSKVHTVFTWLNAVATIIAMF